MIHFKFIGPMVQLLLVGWSTCWWLDGQLVGPMVQLFLVGWSTCWSDEQLLLVGCSTCWWLDGNFLLVRCPTFIGQMNNFFDQLLLVGWSTFVGPMNDFCWPDGQLLLV